MGSNQNLQKWTFHVTYIRALYTQRLPKTFFANETKKWDPGTGIGMIEGEIDLKRGTSINESSSSPQPSKNEKGETDR